jgi:hypothetical protein
MKYESEIDNFLKDLFYGSWMSDEEYKEFIEITFNKVGMTKQELSVELEIGIQNGYSIEKQLQILKTYII